MRPDRTDREWINWRAETSDTSHVRALSIRQPFAELILRGIKTIEYRSRPTRIIGERFWIYASKSKDEGGRMKDEEVARTIWSNDLAVPGPKAGKPPAWLMELAQELVLDKLPRGVIVGSAVIEKVVPFQLTTNDQQRTTLYEWHLADVRRTAEGELRKPLGHPQPVWFKAF